MTKSSTGWLPRYFWLREQRQKHKLDPLAYAVLEELAWRAVAGETFVGQDRIAADTHMSRATVNSRYKDLEVLGLIESARRKRTTAITSLNWNLDVNESDIKESRCQRDSGQDVNESDTKPKGSKRDPKPTHPPSSTTLSDSTDKASEDRGGQFTTEEWPEVVDRWFPKNQYRIDELPAFKQEAKHDMRIRTLAALAKRWEARCQYRKQKDLDNERQQEGKSRIKGALSGIGREANRG